MPENEKKIPAWLVPIVAIVGPAAVMTAGIMGPGSTGSLLLAGAWFHYDLLWIALIVLPAIVICLDSGARIGILSGGKGMLSVIRDEIHPGVTWFVLLVMVLFNIFVNMGMVSVMTESALTIAGIHPPDASAAPEAARGYQMTQFALSIVFGAAVLGLLLSGEYKRVQKILTGLLFFVFLCYFIVAVRGFVELPAILGGLVPSIPEDLPVPGGTARSTYASLISIAGGGLAAAPILSFSYFTADDRARPEDLPRYFWKSVFTLGVMYGLYSVLVLVAGGFALYPLENHAGIQEVHQAGRVLTKAIGPIGPRIFAMGLFTCGLNTFVVVSQLMCYFCLDTFRQDWHYTRENSKFRMLLAFWVLVPALLSSLWKFPAPLKMVLLMGLNIVIVPMAIVIIIYLINKPGLMGAYRANAWRNVFLVASLLLALWLAHGKAPDYAKKIRESLRAKPAQSSALFEPEVNAAPGNG